MCITIISIRRSIRGTATNMGLSGCMRTCCFYSELPATVEPAPYAGKLATNLRPDNWGEVMDPHFRKWSEMQPDQAIWKKLTLVLTIPHPHTGKGE